MENLEGQNGPYVCGEELDGNLVIGGSNEREKAGPGELDEEVHPVQDQDNKWAKKRLTKATERNVKIGEKIVRPVKTHTGSKARYFRPCRNVDRWPK